MTYKFFRYLDKFRRQITLLLSLFFFYLLSNGLVEKRIFIIFNAIYPIYGINVMSFFFKTETTLFFKLFKVRLMHQLFLNQDNFPHKVKCWSFRLTNSIFCFESRWWYKHTTHSSWGKQRHCIIGRWTQSSNRII